MINFILKMIDFVLQMMNFVLKRMDFILKMIGLADAGAFLHHVKAAGLHDGRRRRGRAQTRGTDTAARFFNEKSTFFNRKSTFFNTNFTISQTTYLPIVQGGSPGR